MFPLLLKIRVQSALNVATDTLKRHLWVAIGLALLGIALFGGMTAGFWIFFTFAGRFDVLGETVYQIFYFLFLFLLAGAVPFVASTLLQSADYELLFASPVAPRTVVAAKLLDATVTNSLQFSVLGIPAIVACATVLQLPILAWLLLPLLIGLFVLIPALITALALLIALAMLGMRRLRAAITTLNAVMALLVCATIVLEAGHLPLKPSAFGATLTSIQPTLASTSTTAHHSPSAWFAEMVLGLARGDAAGWYAGCQAFFKIVLMVVALYGVSMALGGRLLSAASLAEEQSSTGAAVASGRDAARSGWTKLFKPPVAALLIKDFKYLLRDSVLLSQLTMPIILFFVPFLLAYQDPAIRQRDEILPFVMGMTGVILFMQTSILSLSALGLESQGFWVLLIAPNAGKTLLWAKFLLSVLFSSAVGILLTLIAWIAFRISPQVVLIELALIVCSASGLCGLGVGISGAFPRFFYDNPAHRVSAWALILGFFATTGYLLVSGLLFVLGWFVTSQMESQQQITLFWTVCVLLYLTMTVYAVYLPIEIGARRIDRYQWEH